MGFLPKIVSLQKYLTKTEMTIEEQILEFSKGRSSFTVSQLQSELGDTLDLARPRLNWYLSKLADERKLIRIARGIYQIAEEKRFFAPTASEGTAALFHQFHERFPEVGACVYEGPWFFQFMHHVAINQVTYIEVEKDVAETVFHQLQDQGKVVYLRPNKDLIYNYIDLKNPVIFIKNLISESPLQRSSDVQIPTLEKLLVDMYCDEDFYYLQGGEYYHIMHYARSRYAINLSRLRRYARRRNAETKIMPVYQRSQYDID